MRATGIDISKYDTSYFPLQDAPQFVIQRASYGMNQDEKYYDLLPGVRATPRRGAYHYLSSNVPWKLQADRFLSISGESHQFYACDFEQAFNNVNATYAGYAVEFIKYVRRETGKRCLLYTTSYMYRDWILRYFPKDAPTFDFWVAQYPLFIPSPQTANPAMLPARKDWTFWQYSPGEKNSEGAKNGVGRRGCDVDVFNGTLEELDAWIGITPPVEPPTEPPVVMTPSTVTLTFWNDGKVTSTDWK